VVQTGSIPYTIDLVLEWSNGTLVGSSIYPELDNCRGDLVNPRIVDGGLHIDEVIVEGTHACVDTTLELRRSGVRLDYSFRDYSSSVNGRGEGVLSKAER
jgi:hypothetical protein